MAGNAVIGALRVVLGADTAALETGLKGAQSKLASFGNAVKMSGAVIAGALAGIVGGVAVGIKQAIDEADKMGKMAQSFGVPVEELSRLKHAADLSDVSIEMLGKSMGKLSKNMMEAAGGAQNQFTQTMAALGLSVQNTDGSLKSSSQVMTEIAGKFGNMQDGAGKTAIAMELFGKAGASLIPMLNSGADGLRAMMAEADALGIVIDSKTAKAAENFNDNLTRLGKVQDGITLKIAAELAPALQVLSDRFVQAAKDGDMIKMSSDAIKSVMNFLAAEIAEVSIRVQGLAAEFKALWAMLSSPTWEGMKKGFADFWAVGAETEARVKSMRDTIGTFWKDVADQAAAGSQENGTKIAAPIVVASEVAKKSLAEAEAAFKKAEAAGLRIYEGTRTPVETFRNEVAKLNILMQQGHIDANTYARAIADAQDKMVQANPAAQILGNSLETAFGRAMEKGAQLGDVLRSLLQDLAKATASAAFRQLLSGNASSGGTSGGILGSLFGGLKLPGFATGGSFTVGGAGGIDSQVAAMRVTPGEQVTVTKPGQSAGGAGGMVYNDNRTFNDVTADIMAKIDARIRATVPVIKQQVMRDLPKQRAMNPNFYSPG
jgi:hypothetical protein